MNNYEQLVKALRCCSKDKCGQCEYEWNPNREFCMNSMCADAAAAIEALQAELPKRGEWILTNDEIETIRIHMNAIKEQLCNQYRHNEAEAYQIIVDKLAKMEAQE